MCRPYPLCISLLAHTTATHLIFPRISYELLLNFIRCFIHS
jgi:hypothetical protein